MARLKLKVKGYSSHEQVISELPAVTCYMGSNSVTCHPTQINIPDRLALDLSTLGVGDWLRTEMVYLSAEGHPSKY